MLIQHLVGHVLEEGSGYLVGNYRLEILRVSSEDIERHFSYGPDFKEQRIFTASPCCVLPWLLQKSSSFYLSPPSFDSVGGPHGYQPIDNEEKESESLNNFPQSNS